MNVIDKAWYIVELESMTLAVDIAFVTQKQAENYRLFVLDGGNGDIYGERQVMSGAAFKILADSTIGTI